MKTFFTIFAFALLLSCASNETNTTVHNSTNHAPANNTAANVDHNSMGHGSSSDHSTMSSSEGAATAPYDLQFIDTMIAHHQGAIDMANLAATRAQHQELKDLAANIIDVQEREIARMGELREKWFAEKTKAINMELPGMSHGMGGMDLKKLEKLTGNDFDIEFLKQMIAHHEGAIDMAKDLRRQDSHAELKELAEDIQSAQDAEIKQMRDWLKAWQTKN